MIDRSNVSSPELSGLRTSSLLVWLAICISVNFQILLPVVPVMAEGAGGHGVGGAATAVLFFGAVAGELSAPWLMSRVRSKHLLTATQLLAAASSLVYVMTESPLLAMIGGAGVRGFGMGLATVVSVSLLFELSSPKGRGASIGLYGLALSAPSVPLPSIGLWLLANGHPDVDGLVACAAAVVGAMCVFRIREGQPHRAGISTNLGAALTRPGLLGIFCGFVIVSTSFGGVVTYAPLVMPLEGLGSATSFLFVFGAARAASRWVAGIICDRQPALTVLIVGTFCSLAGLLVLPFHADALAVLLAAIAYGAGYGASQTGAYLAMAERGRASDFSAVSTLWNSGIDIGASIGGILFGLVAAPFGYSTAGWVLAFGVAGALPLFLWFTKRAPSPMP